MAQAAKPGHDRGRGDRSEERVALPAKAAAHIPNPWVILRHRRPTGALAAATDAGTRPKTRTDSRARPLVPSRRPATTALDTPRERRTGGNTRTRTDAARHSTAALKLRQPPARSKHAVAAAHRQSSSLSSTAQGRHSGSAGARPPLTAKSS